MIFFFNIWVKNKLYSVDFSKGEIRFLVFWVSIRELELRYCIVLIIIYIVFLGLLF